MIVESIWQWIRLFVAVDLIALTCVPLLWAALPRGGMLWFCLARPVGLVLFAVLAWTIAATHVLELSWFSLTVCWGILLLLAIEVLRGRWSEFLRDMERTVGSVWVAEVVFLLAFLAAVLLKMAYPQTVGAEKPMDEAFLLSLRRSVTVPPGDPWLSGEPFRYYYFGHFIMAAVTRWGMVGPEYAYNLSLALAFGLSCYVTFALVQVLSGSRLAGCLGVYMVALMGNWQPLVARFRGEWASGLQDWLWKTSRVVVDRAADGVLEPCINEYPAFTFFWSDLHAHLLAIPLLLACVGLAAGMAGLERTAGRRSYWLLLVALPGAMLTALAFCNPYFWLGGAACVAGMLWIGTAESKSVGRRICLSAGPVLMSLILFLPLSAFCLPAIAGGGIPLAFRAFNTGRLPFLTIFGCQMGLAILLLAGGPWRSLGGNGRLTGTIGILGLVAAVVFAATGFHVSGLLVLLSTAVVCLWNGSENAARPGLLLVGVGLFLILACEWLYVPDPFAGRMNTLFKMHLSAWVLLGLGLPLLAANLYHLGGRRRWLLAAAVPLIVPGMLFPFVSVGRVLESRTGPLTLSSRYHFARENPATLRAYEFIEKHTAPGEAVVQMYGICYDEGGDLSHRTGVPVLLGWAQHEQTWRGPSAEAEIALRRELTTFLYSGPPREFALRQLQQRGVRYIFWGAPEERQFGLAALATLRRHYPCVFEDGSVAVFEMIDAAPGIPLR